MVEHLEIKNEFVVSSFSDKSQQYLGVYLDKMCPDSCLRFAACNICLHTFNCSCINNVIKLHFARIYMLTHC